MIAFQTFFERLYHPAPYVSSWKLTLIHIVSSLAIAIGCTVIPALLFYLSIRVKQHPNRNLLRLLASSILSVGVIFAFSVWGIWFTDYWLSALAKGICGGFFLATAITLWKLFPKMLVDTRSMMVDFPRIKAANMALKDIHETTGVAMLALSKQADATLNERGSNCFSCETSGSLESLVNSIKKLADTWDKKEIENVTSRYLERELYKTEILRAKLDSARYPAVLADERGKIIAVNRAVGNLLGYHDWELIDQPVSCIMPMRYRDRHNSAFGKAITSGFFPLMGRELIVHALKKNGEEIKVRMYLDSWKVDDNVFFSGQFFPVQEPVEITFSQEETERNSLKIA